MTVDGDGSRDDVLAPVDLLAVEFPDGELTASGFERLLALTEDGVVDILDMEFVSKDADGNSQRIEDWTFAMPHGVDLSAWAGASSHLLDDADITEIAAAIRPGSVAVVVIYENRWVLRVVDEWRAHGGARLVASAGLSPDDVIAALDATEAS